MVIQRFSVSLFEETSTNFIIMCQQYCLWIPALSSIPPVLITTHLASY